MCRYRGHSHTSGPLPGSWLAARMANLTPDLQVCLSWGSIAESFQSLQPFSVTRFHVILGLPGPRFPSTCMTQAVLTAPFKHWSVPLVHTSRAFVPSGWGSDPQCQAAQVAHWTWWWQYLGAWHYRSVWSLPCHPLQTLEVWLCHWHGALCSAHKSCTRCHVSWKRGVVKKELVVAPWISSRRFSPVLWLKVHGSHDLSKYRNTTGIPVKNTRRSVKDTYWNQ